MWQRQYEGGTWRILAYDIVGNCLKSITEKKKNGGISQAVECKDNC